jgi:hypothetical protein
MSRILRRPMFRGGPVDSRGTGITSGLMDDMGYADGGRVGFQVGGGLFSSGPYNPYGSYNPFSPISELAMNTNSIINRNITPLQRRNEAIASGKAFDIFAPTERQTYEANRPRTPKQFDEAIQRGLEITRSKPFEISDESFPPRKAMEEPNKEETGTGTGKGGMDLDEEIFDEEKIKRESKLYEKLLGGEEARSQSIYDALLAAAPGFFKGRNLREAAPQVLESINKSGAFDKPRDIRQAAAQLAIQRRIAVETARAKSDDQLTRLEKQLSAKEPKGISELYAANRKVFDNSQEAAMNAAVRTFGADKVASGNSILNKQTKLPDRNLMEPGIIYVINNRYYFLDEKGNPRENYM